MFVMRKLSRQVSPHVVVRGTEYFHRGKVLIHEATDSYAEAVVRGGAPYEVRLGVEGDTVFGSCTCPYFAREMDVCKHVWAALLAAESRGVFGATSPNPISFVAPVPGFESPDEGQSPFGDEFSLDDEPGDFTTRRPPIERGPAGRPTSWKTLVARLLEVPSTPLPRATALAAEEEILYTLDVSGPGGSKSLVLEVLRRRRKADGQWGKPRALALSAREVWTLAERTDRRILDLLSWVGRLPGGWAYPYGPLRDRVPARLELSGALAEALVPLLGASGRCALKRDGGEGSPAFLRWDDGPPWEFRMAVRRAEGNTGYELAGSLYRNGEIVPLSEPCVLLRGGLVFIGDRAARLEDHDAFDWIVALREHGFIRVPAEDGHDLVHRLLRGPLRPPLGLPEELRWSEEPTSPRPALQIRRARTWRRERLEAQLSFVYGASRVPPATAPEPVLDPGRRVVIPRDLEAERRASERLRALGLKRWNHGAPEPGAHELIPRKLPGVAAALLREGWLVEAEGRLYRNPRAFRIEVSTGVDWFDLTGEASFEGESVGLPELLAAVSRGEKMVRLGDGSYGLLPEQWLRRLGPMAGLGSRADGSIRFRRSQVGLLDALLATEPEASWDEAAERARKELRRFEGVSPAEPPRSFRGRLRGYQKDGLGWMLFLERFGFGGCLADDMGLGKTVQVLALLESRRASRGKGPSRPSLVVVPRSLVFNWKQEAARFVPGLRILDYTGLGRRLDGDAVASCDVVLTTYGTLRRDIGTLRGVAFDYLVLDEAQAIKNSGTDTAKAVRLLGGDHRLALSGTPIENHLGELWSLFEFLNPGMLGSASVFGFAGAGSRTPDDATREILSRALRPFILRRTKEQAAPELPPRTEQTIHCELDARQRRLYDEMREHYRRSLASRIEREGIGRSKIHILEALLRLRQAACHPGLLDPARAEEPSAKLETLLPKLGEVADEKHKALVFSQFTTLLGLLRRHLDRQGFAYAYLDGRTRDRRAQVERFQTDPDCKLFLVSLKAGGLGLNLTSAEYVFLLDPWWNPAVDAQAVDRAHRIGQTRPVFAYRLVSRDTVEEKILELQRSKRELADAIVRADESLIRTLTREDLELLLS